MATMVQVKEHLEVTRGPMRAWMWLQLNVAVQALPGFEYTYLRWKMWAKIGLLHQGPCKQKGELNVMYVQFFPSEPMWAVQMLGIVHV